MRALLVAEESVLPVLPAALEGLAKWQIADQTTIVVPQRQLTQFAKFKRLRSRSFLKMRFSATCRLTMWASVWVPSVGEPGGIYSLGRR